MHKLRRYVILTTDSKILLKTFPRRGGDGVDGREIKRVTISEAAPGMITAQDIYSRTDQLILMKDTVLGADSIAKLMFYSVGGIWVYAKEGQDFKEDAYTQALRKGTDFHEFQDVYGDVVKSVRGILEQFMLGEKPIDSEVLFDSVKKMIGEARSNAQMRTSKY